MADSMDHDGNKYHHSRHTGQTFLIRRRPHIIVTGQQPQAIYGEPGQSQGSSDRAILLGLLLTAILLVI